MRIYYYLATLGTIIVLTTLALHPGLQGGFYHDDLPNLVYNNEIKIDNLSITELKEAALSSNAGVLKRPLSMVSFSLNYYFFGDSPFSFKLTNLILHTLTCILLFFVAFKLRALSYTNDVSQANIKLEIIIFAFIVTLVWAIHPIQVSTVNYIVQRMTILSSMFMLCSLLFYLHARTNQNNKHALPFYLFLIFSLISLVAGVLSKENAILAIGLVVAFEFFLFQDKKNNDIKLNKFIVLSAVLVLALSAFFIFPKFYVYLTDWYYRSREFTLEERLYTQFRVLLSYLKWFFFPNIQEMGLYHDDITLSKSIISPITSLTSLVFILTSFAIAIFVRRKKPLISLGIAWFFIGHLLESTIIPLEIAYEHRNYLPYMGLAIILADLVLTLHKKTGSYRSVIVLIIAISCVLVVKTYIRSSQWQDPLSFAVFEAKHHPNSQRANQNLGMAYRSLVLSGETQFIDEAYHFLERASQLRSPFIQPEAALFQLSYELKRPISSEWVNSMSEKLRNNRIRGDHAKILKQISLCSRNECFLPEETILFILNTALQNPRIHLWPSVYSSVLSSKANFLMQQGLSVDDSEKLMLKAIDLSEENTQYYVDYINLLALKGDHQKAAMYLNRALKTTRDADTVELLSSLRSRLNKSALDVPSVLAK